MNGTMSAFGTKRTSLITSAMSAFGGKADIVRSELCEAGRPDGHDPSLENGAGYTGPFSIALDSYDGTYLSISS